MLESLHNVLSWYLVPVHIAHAILGYFHTCFWGCTSPGDIPHTWETCLRIDRLQTQLCQLICTVTDYELKTHGRQSYTKQVIAKGGVKQTSKVKGLLFPDSCYEVKQWMNYYMINEPLCCRAPLKSFEKVQESWRVYTFPATRKPFLGVLSTTAQAQSGCTPFPLIFHCSHKLNLGGYCCWPLVYESPCV